MTELAANSPEVTISSYFYNELLLLRIVGLSLYENEGLPYRCYSWFILVFVAFLFAVLNGWKFTKHGFYDGKGDVIVYETALFLLLVRTAVLLRNRRKIIKLLCKLEQNPFSFNPKRGGESEANLVKECLWVTRTQRLVLWISVLVLAFALLAFIIFSRVTSSDYHDWKFVYAPLTFLNISHSPNYEISVLYQYVSGFYLAPTYVTIDLLLTGILIHISYQFKMLQNYIRHVVEIAGQEMRLNERADSSTSITDSTDTSCILWSYLNKCLDRTVSYHLSILELSDEVEDLFSLLQLGSLLFFIILMCFTIYITSTANDIHGQAIKNAVMFGFASAQALLISYWAGEVLHESQQVGQAAYEASFIGTDLRFQKSLVFIMRRSQTPCKLTAGKFTVLSLATFSWILRTSYSAFTVLRTTNNK